MPQTTITFYDNRGRVETADMHAVVFSDGVKRFICTHTHTCAGCILAQGRLLDQR